MSFWETDPIEHRSRYCVTLLEDARPTFDGVEHGPDEDRSLGPWSAVRVAMNAEVGEPEGVRTVVFDLVLELPAKGEDGIEVQRFDAEPGEDAQRAALLISEQVHSSGVMPSIKSAALDGITTRWYPDLISFEKDNLKEL